MNVLSNIRRLFFILRVCGAHLVAHALGPRLAGWPWLARRLPPGDLSHPRRLCVLLQDLGGTPLKFGQMLALQPDILSIEYCNALFDLLDRVPPFGFAEVERVLREETGVPPAEMFERFEPTPIATASIGQVHVAWLDGRKVAVKVQRPVVEIDFVGDLKLMVTAMQVIRRLRIKPLFWLLEPMGEFVAWTREELDYRNEARYMRQLRENARDNAFEYVPEVFFVSRRVLVAEFLEGVTVLDYLRALEAGDEVTPQRLKALGFDPIQFARRMIDNFLGDAFRHGLFHADLHPANLMILPGSVVGYVDFGITGVLSRYSRLHLVKMTLAYTRADTDGMCEAFLRVTTRDSDADPEAFHDGLRRFADVWYERRRSKSRLRKNFTLVMLDMLRLSRATGIWPERDVIKYIRSAIAIDGLVTRFAPGFSVGDHLAAVCDRTIRQQVRRSMFTRERLVAWTDASASLVRDGASRLAEVFSRLAAAHPDVAGGGALGGEGSGRLEARVLRLASVAFALALLLSFSGRPAELGWNVFTAGATVLTASLALLGRTAFRLAA